MFARSFSALVLALPVLAAASVVTRTDSDQCNTGSFQCCQSTQPASAQEVTRLAGLLGIVLDGITGLVGLTCSPIVGGNSCTNQPVCCTGNNFSGIIVVGCTPININL